MPRKSNVSNEEINQLAARVVRESSEPENMDIAAEATDSARAKSLQPDKRPSKSQSRSAREKR